MSPENFNTPKQPTKAPHSGTAGIEFPVVPGVEAISEKVVANTEIPGTVTAGLGGEGSVEASEKATWDQGKAAVRDSYVQPKTPKKPSHMGRNITLGLAAVSVAAGGWFGIHAANEASKTETLPPEPTDVASAPVTPGAQESTAPAAAETAPAPVVTKFELKKDMTEEEASKAVVGIISEWWMSGADEQTYTSMRPNYGTDEAESKRFAEDIAAKYDDLYIKKLFGDSYNATDPVIAKFINNIKNAHETNLDLYLYTAPAYFQNHTNGLSFEQQSYQSWNQTLAYKDIKFTSDVNGQKNIAIQAEVLDNRDSNDVGKQYTKTADANILITATFPEGDMSHLETITYTQTSN